MRDGVDVSARGHVGGRDLVAATVVGGVLLALVAAALWWRSDVFVAVVLLAVVAAFVDLCRVLTGAAQPVLIVLVLGAAVMLPATYVAGASGQVGGVFTVLVGAIIWLLSGEVNSSRLSRTAGTVLAGVWVLLPASFALILITYADGQTRLAFTIGIVALTDIAGYAIGVPFGRHKLSARLSPNKTIEGLLGGVIVSMVVAALMWPALFDGVLWHGVVFGLVVAIACAVGDIAESGVKRALGVKDFGTFLPGHGGVLDRIDGLLFALPVATVVFFLL